jgi:type I restriction enzyme S subunit
MIPELKPYADYKESGLPWLGKFPAQWVIKRGKSYLYAVDKRSEKGSEELLTVSSARGVVPRRTANVTMFKAESYAGHKLCWPNDLVINSLWAWAGGLGVSQHHGIISTAYSVYRGRPSAGINPRFLHELVRSSAFHWELKVRSKGVWISRLQLTDTAFLDAPIPLPPPDEQAAIVRFLNWANGRLEKAIRAKRKVITLLNEQKQAIIHRAVTRGLDPSVPLKPSGIPWIGEIPVHWEVYRLSFIAEFSNGKAHEQFFDPNGEYICVNARFVSTGGREIKYCTKNLWPARRGDVLMVMSDLPNGRALARAYLVNEERKYAVNQRVCRLRPKRVEAGFLVYVANRNYGLLRYDDGFNQTHLSAGDYKTLAIQCPPIEEQRAILRFLDIHVSTLAKQITHLEREIDLLLAYRTRLVADIVTGKLDVREAASKLPDETPVEAGPDESDLQDETDDEELVA